MLQNKKILAIIPARGGSKGIPQKNIKNLAGKPLIAYTIIESIKSDYIDRIIVSTDDENIASIARKLGAETPFLRPEKLARDSSTSLSVILHTLKYLSEKEEYIADIIVFLQPTSPFRHKKYIDEAIEKIIHCNAVVGICPVREHPYFMMKKNIHDFLTPFVQMENRPLRRQDVPDLFYINASIFIAWSTYYNKVKDSDPVAPVFSNNVQGVVMDEVSSLDINDEFDFKIAENILSSDVIVG